MDSLRFKIKKFFFRRRHHFGSIGVAIFTVFISFIFIAFIAAYEGHEAAAVFFGYFPVALAIFALIAVQFKGLLKKKDKPLLVAILVSISFLLTITALVIAKIYSPEATVIDVLLRLSKYLSFW